MPLFPPLVVTVTLETDASPDTVWAAFETVSRWPEVIPDIAEGRIVPDGKLESGAVIETRAAPGRPMIDMSYHVVTVEPPHRLVLLSRANGFIALTDYGVRRTEFTEVTATATVEAERFVGGFSARLMRKSHTEHLTRSVERRLRALLTLAEKMRT